MTEQKHTLEPWHTIKRRDEDDASLVAFENDFDFTEGIIAECGSFHTGRAIGEDAANARRIAACVNACKGIPNEALESGVIGEMLEALEYLYANADLTHGDRLVSREAIAKAKGEKK